MLSKPDRMLLLTPSHHVDWQENGPGVHSSQITGTPEITPSLVDTRALHAADSRWTSITPVTHI